MSVVVISVPAVLSRLLALALALAPALLSAHRVPLTPPPALVRPQVIGRVAVATPRATGIAVRPIVVGLKMYLTMLKLCPPVA